MFTADDPKYYLKAIDESVGKNVQVSYETPKKERLVYEEIVGHK